MRWKILCAAVFHSLDPQLAIMQVQTMDEAVSSTEAPRRFNTTIITAFGVIAVLLAILGIYSVVAFSVALRTQEMAIRLALGASRSGIRQLILSCLEPGLPSSAAVLGWPAPSAQPSCFNPYYFKSIHLIRSCSLPLPSSF